MKLNNVDFDTYFENYPDKNGYFGKYGGVYVDEKLKNAMAEGLESGIATNFNSEDYLKTLKNKIE